MKYIVKRDIQGILASDPVLSKSRRWRHANSDILVCGMFLIRHVKEMAMKKQLTLTTLVLSATMIAGTSWAGPCKNGANPGPRVDCQEANLRGMNLSGADLQGANLRRAILLQANMKGANLQGANLQSADLRWANLQGANMQEAFLGKARWVNGHLCKPESYTFCK